MVPLLNAGPQLAVRSWFQPRPRNIPAALGAGAALASGAALDARAVMPTALPASVLAGAISTGFCRTAWAIAL